DFAVAVSGAAAPVGTCGRHAVGRADRGRHGARRLPHPAAATRADHERDYRHGRHVDPVHQRVAHHLGLGAAALSRALRHGRLCLCRRAHLAPAVLDHGHRARHHGGAAALPQAHPDRHCHAGGRAGSRDRAADGREPDPLDGVHVRHFRHDGGRRRRHARIHVLCVLRDGLRHRRERVHRRDIGRARQHCRRDARRHSVRPHRDVQHGVFVVRLQGRDRHDPVDRDSSGPAVGVGRAMAETVVASSYVPAAGRGRTVRRVTWLVLAVLVVVPWIDPDKYVLHVLSLIAIASIVAMGLQLLLGGSGQLSIGQAAFYGIGAYASALLTTKLGVPFPLALIGAGVVAAIASLLMVPITRLTGAYLAVATLGFSILVYLVIKNEEWLTGGSYGFISIPRAALFGYVLRDAMYAYYLCVGVAALVYLVFARIEGTRFGRAINAIRQDADAAAASGLPVTLLKSQCFVIAAFVAGLAGS